MALQALLAHPAPPGFCGVPATMESAFGGCRLRAGCRPATGRLFGLRGGFHWAWLDAVLRTEIPGTRPGSRHLDEGAIDPRPAV